MEIHQSAFYNTTTPFAKIWQALWWIITAFAGAPDQTMRTYPHSRKRFTTGRVDEDEIQQQPGKWLIVALDAAEDQSACKKRQQDDLRQAIKMQEVTASARFEIYGRVQGVGYRAFVIGVARPLRLEGWVRNREDGAVEVAALGSAADVERLHHRLKTGPPGARVTRVERREWDAPESRGGGFVILG